MKKCILSGFVGALCMFLLILGVSFFRYKHSSTEYEVRKQEVKYESTIDKLACFVCGIHTDPLTAHYWDEDNIGVLNLNTFEVLYIEINRYDDNGELIKEPSGVLVSNGMKCGDSVVHSWTDPDRGYAHIDISNITWEIDAQNLQNRLCQDCLDQINSDCFF